MRICFTHVSDEYREFFTSATKRRPTFYWFTDRYYDHLHQASYPSWKYFYFFLKDPLKDKIEFRSRSDESGFHGLFDSYVNFRDWAQCKEKGIPHEFKVVEPGIFYSFSKIIPNLIGQYDEKKKEVVVIWPEQFKGTSLGLFHEDGLSKNFLETKLPMLLSEMKEALPFVEPEQKNGKFHYAGWIPMKTQKNGMWI